MPELPEVETTIKGLRPLVNSTIINIKIYTLKLRYLIPKNITRLNRNIFILNMKRKGKYILIYLNNNFIIVFHLGMSGRLILLKNNRYKRQKHDHLIIKTNAGHYLIFNDARKFGFIDYGHKASILKKKYILKLGEDALSRNLTGKYLYKKICYSNVYIKQILLNQSIIAGIGNIYASEILFSAKISPLDRGNDLSMKDCNKIIVATRKILNKAIKSGGSTLKDYISADGTLGNFQTNFKVYNKNGQKVAGKLVKKITQHGRSTFYSPGIQKKKC